MKKLNRKSQYAIVTLVSALLLLLLYTVYSPASYAHKSDEFTTADSTKLEYFLELKGNVRRSKSVNETEEIKPIDSALVGIYYKDTLFSEVYTNKKGRCVFKLALDKNCKIMISKKGFTTKFFEVNTNVPNDKKNTFSFSFDIDLFEEIKGLDISVLKKPIAKVAYNVILEQFAYDINYTSRINFDLKKMYKSYYSLQLSQMDPDSLNGGAQPPVPQKAQAQKVQVQKVQPQAQKAQPQKAQSPKVQPQK